MAPRPSADTFVAKLASEPTSAPPDPDLELVEADGSTLAVIRVPGEGGPTGARDNWQRLNAEDRFEWVAPALVDDDGQAHLPTGQITVRFAEPPDTGQIDRFAARHDLRVDHRNELSPRQVVFAPARPESAYLPEMAEAARRDGEVAAAWPNTLSSFEKSTAAGPAPGTKRGKRHGRAGRAAKRRR